MALQLAVIAVVLAIISVAIAFAGQNALEEQYGLRAQGCCGIRLGTPRCSGARRLVCDLT